MFDNYMDDDDNNVIGGKFKAHTFGVYLQDV
jgi:hypothetical protein